MPLAVSFGDRAALERSPPSRLRRPSATLVFQALVTFSTPSTSAVPIDARRRDRAVDGERAVVGRRSAVPSKSMSRVDRAEAAQALPVSAPRMPTPVIVPPAIVLGSSQRCRPSAAAAGRPC